MLARIGCSIVATEIDPLAFNSAVCNVELNDLQDRISIIYSESSESIITHLFESLDGFNAIITNPPQYDEDFYKFHSNQGFTGQKIELVGGTKGHEFILNLLNEVQAYKSHPNVYFQLTLPHLVEELNKMLYEADFAFVSETIKIGTRQRIHYKISF